MTDYIDPPGSTSETFRILGKVPWGGLEDASEAHIKVPREHYGDVLRACMSLAETAEIAATTGEGPVPESLPGAPLQPAQLEPAIRWHRDSTKGVFPTTGITWKEFRAGQRISTLDVMTYANRVIARQLKEMDTLAPRHISRVKGESNWHHARRQLAEVQHVVATVAERWKVSPEPPEMERPQSVRVSVSVSAPNAREPSAELSSAHQFSGAEWDPGASALLPEISDGRDEVTADPERLAQLVDLLRRTPGRIPAGGSLAPKAALRTSTAYERSAAVIASILRASGAVCEACDEPAPFTTGAGAPFLEVHHVVPLSENGPDVATNAVALCPNCHRAMHHAHDALERRDVLYTKIARLVRP